MQDNELLRTIDKRSLENREEIVKLKECQILIRRDIDEQGADMSVLQSGLAAIHGDMLLIKNQLAGQQKIGNKIFFAVLGVIVTGMINHVFLKPQEIKTVDPAILDKLESIEERLD